MELSDLALKELRAVIESDVSSACFSEGELHDLGSSFLQIVAISMKISARKARVPIESETLESL